MKRYLIEFIVRCSILSLLLAGVLIQATPQSYDLFQGSAYSGGGNRHRNKNLCARVVYKNVTCSVLGSAESFLEPELAPCPPHQPDCEQRMMYRTQFRPTYRTAYKTVTQLEWRCCPGFQGPDCTEHKGSIPVHTVQRTRPYHQPQPIPAQTQHRPRPATHDWGQGGDRVRRLEGEMQQLSQTVRDLQAAITGMNENLRLDVQEDTSKMLLTLLNTLHLPVGDLTTGSTEHVQLVSHTHPSQEHGTSPDNPASSSQGHSASPQGHTPSSQGHAPSPQGHTPSSANSDPSSKDQASSSDGHASFPLGPADSPHQDPLHSVMEKRFQELRGELLESMEEKMAALQDSCDLGLQSVQNKCEQQGAGYRSLAQQLERKEEGLKEEIRQLRLQLGSAEEGGAVRTLRGASEMSDLRREVGRLADAHRVLNARVDNEVEHLSALSIQDLFGPRLDELEGRINVTERNAETLCFYIDEKLSRRISNETDALRTLLEERLGTTEDQFTAMLVEIASGNHNVSNSGSFTVNGLEDLRQEAKSNGRQIQSLEEKLNALGKQCSGGCGTDAGAFDDILREVRLLGSELETVRADSNAGDREKLQDLESLVQNQLLIGQHNSRNLADQQAGLLALRGEVGALKGSIDSLGESMGKQAAELRNLNSSCGRTGAACREPSEHESPTANGSQVDELRVRLDQLSREVRAELSRRRFDPAGGNKAGGDVTNSLQRVADTLNRHAASVWGRVQQLHAAQRTQAQGITALATSVHHLQAQLATVAHNTPGSSATSPGQPTVNAVKDYSGPAAGTRPLSPGPRPGGAIIPHIRVPLTPNRIPPVSILPLPAPHQPSNALPPSHPHQPSSPQQPVMETGEAGPPGTLPRMAVRVSHSPDTPSEPEQGYAAAPGYPPLSPMSYQPRIVPVAYVPQKQADRPLVMPGGGVASEPFSFSAGLTAMPLPWLMGVIRFDKVLVNDGGHYDPRTGIFTAPQEGRYLVSAVLTPQQGERVEGALSVSDRSVQRLTTTGPAHQPRPCVCGSSASLSLVLHLRRGDRVAVVRTAGKLAVSEPKEVLSTFSAIFLYSAPSVR